MDKTALYNNLMKLVAALAGFGSLFWLVLADKLGGDVYVPLVTSALAGLGIHAVGQSGKAS